MNHTKTIMITLLCLVVSLSFASEENTNVLSQLCVKTDKKIAQTQQKYVSAKQAVDYIVTILEAPVYEIYDQSETLNEAKLDQTLINSAYPLLGRLQMCNMKLKKHINIKKRIIKFEKAKEASRPRLEKMLVDAQKQGIADRLDFDNN